MKQRQVMIELEEDEIETLKFIITMNRLDSAGTVEQGLTFSLLEIILAPFLEEEE